MENGLLQLDQGGLASQAVTALLPQVVSHQDDFTSQAVSNLLWALAKLVENGLLQLEPGRPGQPGGDGAVAAGGDPRGSFKPQEISTLGWRNWWRTGCSSGTRAASDPSGTVYLSATCCGRWRNWWRTDCSSWTRAAWPARR